MKKMRLVLFFLLFINLSSKGYSQELQTTEKEKTILVTGAAGFIGSNFLKYMFDKYPTYQFIVLDALTYAGSLDKIPKYIQQSERFEFIHDTINNPEAVNKAMSKSHMVVHFAAETHVTRSIYEDEPFFITDVLGTRILMNAVRKYEKRIERFVHISTSEVYGTAEGEEMMDENHPLNPRSPYAAAKAGADRLVYSYCCTYDVPAVILRPFNNYGPGQHLEKLIPRMITSAIRKEQLTIHGNGEQRRDWVYTLDVAQAVDAVLHHKNFDEIKHQVINIGSGKAVSVLEIAKRVLAHFNLPESYLTYVGDRPGQVECHISSTKKATDLLGWSASTSLDAGLKLTIQWYIDHPEIWEKMLNDAHLPIVTVNGEVEEQ